MAVTKMSKERLDMIEVRFRGFDFEVEELGKDFDYLIDQARQTIDLAVAYNNAKKEIEILENKIGRLDKAFSIENKLHLKANKDADRLDKQNKRYRKALKGDTNPNFSD